MLHVGKNINCDDSTPCGSLLFPQGCGRGRRTGRGGSREARVLQDQCIQPQPVDVFFLFWNATCKPERYFNHAHDQSHLTCGVLGPVILQPHCSSKKHSMERKMSRGLQILEVVHGPLACCPSVWLGLGTEQARCSPGGR